MTPTPTPAPERDARRDIPSPGLSPDDSRVVSWLHVGSGCAHERPEAEAPETGVAVLVCTYRRPESLERCLESVARGARVPDALVVVDASPEDATEKAVAALWSREAPAPCCLYFRVEGSLRGLTRQRNFALRWVRHDLAAFFDDDLVLRPDCVAEMERTHRALGDGVVGVGARIENAPRGDSRLWRLRRRLRIVPSLAPGRYYGSGMSTPWELADDSDSAIDGDWLPGGAAMWKARVAREIGFYEGFQGYAQGEDLDFCLRARARGRFVLARSARVTDLHEAAGRPDHYRLGYMAIHNRYLIHRRGLPNRRRRDAAWFAYSWAVDTLLLARHFAHPGRWGGTLAHLAGRVRATADLLRGR